MEERRLSRGKRIDTGEWIIGWLVHDDLIREQLSGCTLSTKEMSADGHFECDVVRVEPDTVESVAVKVKIRTDKDEGGPQYGYSEVICPNCDISLLKAREIMRLLPCETANYCHNCGQRLDLYWHDLMKWAK